MISLKLFDQLLILLTLTAGLVFWGSKTHNSATDPGRSIVIPFRSPYRLHFRIRFCCRFDNWLLGDRDNLGHWGRAPFQKLGSRSRGSIAPKNRCPDQPATDKQDRPAQRTACHHRLIELLFAATWCSIRSQVRGRRV
jgi:hypothetical protein